MKKELYEAVFNTFHIENKPQIDAIFKEAKALSKSHPSKDCQSFAHHVVKLFNQLGWSK